MSAMVSLDWTAKVYVLSGLSDLITMLNESVTGDRHACNKRKLYRTDLLTWS